ncbi:hypothetical protein EI983_11400 [Roseovarius faecimaris]|uniref:Excalibur calcium-binding domain-containing protein n=1 Tax=Roseovarius faecimaris TaxID=2494550 RepID=A0A6I6IRV8_9RHOB|nr:hypothetical protein [Roseovarius faecimaris]QGX98844.1 hypothetical protein EI983_11400 [Roseovarius faecimaris]
MRLSLTLMACAALAACSPSVPDSAAGVGFNDYDAYLAERARRDAALTGSVLPPPDAVSSEPLSADGQTMPSSDAETLAAETRAALTASQANSGVPPVQADPNNPPPQTVTTSTGISSENDFEAVGAQRSIESDAQLIAQNRAQYKVVEPTALPQRSGSTGPNIVAYALSSTHPVGTQVYRRVGFNKEARARRNCAKYTSYEKAQMDFLEKGGPTRDRLGLDPDGDGYACGWDPSPFRNAVPSAGGA